MSKNNTNESNPLRDVIISEESSSSSWSSSSGEESVDDDDYPAHSRLQRIKSAQETNSQSEPKSLKRKRRSFKPQQQSKSNLSSKRKRWMVEVEGLKNSELRSKKCCKTFQCFENCDITFLQERIDILLKAKQVNRRICLYNMLSSSFQFVFDGKPVCSTFLLKSFHFSRDLQASIKSERLDNNNLNANTHTANDEDQLQSANKNVICDRSNTRAGQSSMARDSICNFLNRVAAQSGESMPDSQERHLPFLNKKQVYDLFKAEFPTLYLGERTPGYEYFSQVWSKNCSSIKIRKHTRFSKCTTCEQLRAAIRDALTKGRCTEELKRQKATHLDFVRREREEYSRKIDLAKKYPQDYLSIVVDGADQRNFTLPHFTSCVKDQRGHGLGVHVIGLLNHRQTNVLRLFTMTKDHQSGANHVIEVIHRFTNEVARDSCLPKTLFIQLDNCWRENKNKYLLSYIEYLVLRGVFEEVYVSFLPIGHTHVDIDQTFSTTSNRMRVNDAMTMTEMHEQLSKCYNEQTIVSRIKNCANWSGLCDKTNAIHRLTNITQHRYFRFKTERSTSGEFDAKCVVSVKGTLREEWRLLTTGAENGAACFLKFVPNIEDMPPENLRSPDDKKEVTARIMSEEARIGDTRKIEDLYRLRDEVYKDRSEHFHWDLKTTVELNCQALRKSHSDKHDEHDTQFALQVSGDSSSTPRLEYKMNSFVAVRGEEEDKSKDVLDFWIGEVVDDRRDCSGKVVELSVQWYTFYGKTDIYTAKYKPLQGSLQTDEKGTKKNTLNIWLDWISVDSVFVNFPKLKADKTLPRVVVEHLRQACHG